VLVPVLPAHRQRASRVFRAVFVVPATFLSSRDASVPQATSTSRPSARRRCPRPRRAPPS
jgi:hypothetical protein